MNAPKTRTLVSFAKTYQHEPEKQTDALRQAVEGQRARLAENADMNKRYLAAREKTSAQANRWGA